MVHHYGSRKVGAILPVEHCNGWQTRKLPIITQGIAGGFGIQVKFIDRCILITRITATL